MAMLEFTDRASRIIVYRECVVTPSQLLACVLTVFLLLLLPGSGGWTKELLPLEPDLATRIDEQYDHEARLFLMLYSLKGDGHVDFVTGRLVREYTRSSYGNPVYRLKPIPCSIGGITPCTTILNRMA